MIWRKSKQVENPVFGRVKFYPKTAQEESYWFTSLEFAPCKTVIDCTIYAPESGITSLQGNFYRELECQYTVLESEIEDFIHTQLGLKGWQGQKIRLGQNLQLTSVTIPGINKGTEKMEWTIVYQETRGITWFNIAMENWKPVELTYSS